MKSYEIVAADTRELEQNLNCWINSCLSRYYYSVDEQGSTNIITDKYGKIRNEYWYDAFGNVLESREDVHNRITYTGQQFDSITQQYYLRARFYNPIVGRFVSEDIYRGDGLNLYAYCGNNPVCYYDPSGYAFLDNLLYDSQLDIETRMSQVPRDETQYGYWESDRGNSKFFFENKDKSDFHNRVEKLMNSHNATYVPYKDAQVDFDYFAVFTVDVEVSSKRTITHPNTNQKIAETIIKYEGNYEKMYKDNIMGIASGSKRSQDMAKSIIESVKNEAIDSSLSKDLQIKLAIDELKKQQKLNKQTIHEENLVKGKELNKTQWVDTDINRQFGHLGGTSEAQRLENEKKQKGNCSSK